MLWLVPVRNDREEYAARGFDAMVEQLLLPGRKDLKLSAKEKNGLN